MFRGLAQRTKGRKTSYLDALPDPKMHGKTRLVALHRRFNFEARNWSGRGEPAAGFETIQHSDETIFRT